MIQSVDRALQILEVLKTHTRGLGVTEISNHLDVAKSTAHRLLSSLEKFDYVQKDSFHNTYSLGLKFIEMSETVMENLNIVDISRPLIEKLSMETGEIVHLVIHDQHEIVYIDKVDNRSAIRIYSQIGRRGPLHCTAVGKCILAFMNDHEKERLLQDYTMKSFTENTIVTLEALAQELNRVRSAGFSYDNEEHELGIRCIAAPIFDSSGKVKHAISVTGPINRMTDQHIDKYLPLLKETTLLISKRLGFKSKL